jgi:hypothetical protein
MRAMFLIGSLLVTAAAIQLLVLTDHTDRLFAWTIKNPETACFLGAFYATALTLALLSAREPVWARARVGVLGVFFFVVLSFVATVLHSDQFHFHSSSAVAQGAADLWFAVYLVAPFGILAAVITQARSKGVDPPKSVPVPRWYRGGLIVHSAVVLGFGVGLFAVPEAASKLWPWALTPLTARAIAAWLTGLGLVLGQAAWEGTADRIQVATGAYVVLGVLQLVSLARYPHAAGIDWGSPRPWLYLAFLVTVVFMGAAGWVLARRRPIAPGA